jgi:hypothetical protein
MMTPRALFTNFVSDLLITESGENIPPPPPDYPFHAKLFLLHWDATATNFVANRILVPQMTLRALEHSAFAPISIKPLTP